VFSVHEVFLQNADAVMMSDGGTDRQCSLKGGIPNSLIHSFGGLWRRAVTDKREVDRATFVIGMAEVGHNEGMGTDCSSDSLVEALDPSPRDGCLQGVSKPASTQQFWEFEGDMVPSAEPALSRPCAEVNASDALGGANDSF
jgi:hypothetical protein